MSMRLALTEEPPPQRHWDDPDLDLPTNQRPLKFRIEPVDRATEPSLPHLRHLVVAASPASAALLRESAAEPDFTLFGRMAAEPEEGFSLLEAGVAEGRGPGAADILLCHARGTAVAILTSLCLPPESCYSWTKTLLQACKPERVLVLGPLPPAQFLGHLRASIGTEDLSSQVFFLQTLALEESDPALIRNLPPGFLLPPGVLIDGLPASIISFCQVRHMDALFCSCGFKEASPGSDSLASLAALAALTNQLSARLGLGLALQADSLKPLLRKCASKLRGQGGLDNEMFI